MTRRNGALCTFKCYLCGCGYKHEVEKSICAECEAKVHPNNVTDNHWAAIKILADRISDLEQELSEIHQ